MPVVNESLTPIALRNIREASSRDCQFISPSEILAYLQDDTHFKNLPDLLVETMVKAGVCNADSTKDDCRLELYHRLLDQAVDCGAQKEAARPKIRMRVTRWMEGAENAKSLRVRTQAIEICFALRLDHDQTTTFLNKSGFHGLNVRDVEDAVYLYCILHRYPLSAANRIMTTYRKATVLNHTNSEMDAVHSGDTTMILHHEIENGSWENDEAFIEQFLIPNKAKFIGYATNALKNYYYIKNNLLITILTAIEADEHGRVFERAEYEKELGKDKAEKKVKNSDIPISVSIQKALEKIVHSTSVMYPCSRMLRDDMTNLDAVLRRIRELINTRKDIDAQKQISDVLSNAISMEKVLKYVFHSLNAGKDGLRNVSDSVLKDTVLYGFPDEEMRLGFESDPEEINITLSDRKNIRKLIVLMYFILYAYELSCYNLNYRYASPLFGEEMGFDEFMNGLNTNILKANELPPLYPGNQFDWLILRSIKDIAEYDRTTDGSSPVVFFDRVLAASFEKKRS